MSRTPNGTDFTVDVEGVGAFMFGRRTMRDQFRIQSEYARLTEGVSPVPEDLDIAAGAVSAIKVLTVHAPEGWDIDVMDPLEEDSYVKILKVFGALRAREGEFRQGKQGGSKETGKVPGKDD